MDNDSSSFIVTGELQKIGFNNRVITQAEFDDNGMTVKMVCGRNYSSLKSSSYLIDSP